MDDYREYFEYLGQRGKLTYYMRKYWLYPKICKYLVGKSLDVGPGIGDLISLRENTIGVDINPFVVENIRKRGYEAFLIENGAFPFPDSTFESALMDNVLEHLDVPEPTLEEINRVLKKDGVLVIGVPGIKGYSYDPTHRIFYDARRLMEFAESMGFSHRMFFYVPFKSRIFDRYFVRYAMYGIFSKSHSPSSISLS